MLFCECEKHAWRNGAILADTHRPPPSGGDEERQVAQKWMLSSFVFTTFFLLVFSANAFTAKGLYVVIFVGLVKGVFLGLLAGIVILYWRTQRQVSKNL